MISYTQLKGFDNKFKKNLYYIIHFPDYKIILLEMMGSV